LIEIHFFIYDECIYTGESFHIGTYNKNLSILIFFFIIALPSKDAFSEPDELYITVGEVRAAYDDNKILVNDSQNYQISRFFDNENVLDDEIINIYLYGENFWRGEITDKNNDDYWAEPLIYIELFQPEKVKVKTIVPGKDPPLQDYMVTQLSSVPSSHIHYDNIHASYYKERGLYVGVEPVTADILEWEKKESNWKAQSYLENTLKRHIKWRKLVVALTFFR